MSKINEKINIKTLVANKNITPDYFDNDIVIIDNIQELAETNTARMEMNTIAVCLKGKIQGKMGEMELTLSENQVVLCPPNVILTDIMASPDISIKAIFFTNNILQSFLHEKINLWNDMMYKHKMHTIVIKDSEMGFMQHFYEMLTICIKHQEHNPYRTEVIQSLLRSAFIGLMGIIKQILPTQAPQEMRRTDTLFQQFLDLLGRSIEKHRSVESYASELCISAKHLTNICKQNSGKTALEWITEYVKEDIRYYLRQTDLPIKQICDILGFANPSFFGKYVREQFGQTPLEVRGQKRI